MEVGLGGAWASEWVKLCLCLGVAMAGKLLRCGVPYAGELGHG